MHVLQIAPQYFPNVGGVERVVQKIGENLVARGIRATVYSVDRSYSLRKKEDINGVSVRRFLPLRGNPLFLPEPEFYTALRQEKADIIHAHSIHTLPLFLAAAFKHRNQELLLQPHYHRFGQSSLRNSLFSLYKLGLRVVAIPGASVIIANSEYEKKILCEDFPGCNNVVLMPEGLDVDEVQNVKRDPAVPKQALYVGALRQYKNVDMVLKGFAWLKKRMDSDFRLVIIGTGPQRDSLIALATKLNIASSVEWKFNLSREQLLCEYAKASVFILLSHLESFSIAVYEALLIGVPTVVLGHGPLENLVRDGFAEGVSSLASEVIAKAMRTASSKTYPRISRGPKVLDWQDYTDRIVSIYRKLLEMR
jgi:glycosyltransferase involved in cell wall biosynthesis